jgi:two-component system, cell cycle sensor histidine kinase and response regulator CckA
MAAPRLQEKTSRPATILLVDDEPAVRMFMQRMLAEYGHTAHVATGPEEALALLERTPETIDLVLTDVMMPGMNGCDLGRLIAERWPGRRLLFYSGYGVQELVDQGICTDDMPFLQKPFMPDRLAAKIDEVLQQPPYAFGGPITP